MKNLITTLVVAGSLSVAPARDQGSWIGTWGTSPTGLPTAEKMGSYPLPPLRTFKGTIRYRSRISLGGSHIRLRFSNEYGDRPLNLAAVTAGLAAAESLDSLDALPGSLKRVMFSGKQGVSVPAGTVALSDPLELPVKPQADLVVSIYVPEGVKLAAWTSTADPIVVEGADATLTDRLTSRSLEVRPLLSEIDVLVEPPRKVLVTLGDSITDGFVDPDTGERGWAGALARRLQNQNVAVVNAGIGGNRLLQSLPMYGASALARLDRDVFSVPGVSHVVVLEGINDIGMSGPGGSFGDTPLVAAQDLVKAYLEIVARSHERGIKVYGATITPFGGAESYSADRERIRETVNQWIRASQSFDGVIDFDLALRDAANPLNLKAEYDLGDHLHPNAAGERHMGEGIDLRLFN
jgi:lysophospholipase L1-like esterase